MQVRAILVPVQGFSILDLRRSRDYGSSVYTRATGVVAFRDCCLAAPARLHHADKLSD